MAAISSFICGRIWIQSFKALFSELVISFRKSSSVGSVWWSWPHWCYWFPAMLVTLACPLSLSIKHWAGEWRWLWGFQLCSCNGVIVLISHTGLGDWLVQLWICLPADLTSSFTDGDRQTVRCHFPSISSINSYGWSFVLPILLLPWKVDILISGNFSYSQETVEGARWVGWCLAHL